MGLEEEKTSKTCGFWCGSPHAVDRGGYRHGGVGAGEGVSPPPPERTAFPAISHPATGGGGSHGDTPWEAVPGAR